MRRVSLSRPRTTFSKCVPKSSSADSSTSNGRFVARTASMRLKLAMALRVSPSMMSSSRDCAVRSSRMRWKNRSGSEMRQRAKVSTQMYFLSRVGIWLGSPDHSSQRFSNRLTRSANGSFRCRPGSVTASPLGSPKRVITACSVSSSV